MLECAVCAVTFEGPKEAHESSKSHLAVLEIWASDIWTDPSSFSTTVASQEFQMRRRRPIVSGITLWEMKNHYFKKELESMAKDHGLKLTASDALIINLFYHVNKDVPEIESLKGIPPIGAAALEGEAALKEGFREKLEGFLAEEKANAEEKRTANPPPRKIAAPRPPKRVREDTPPKPEMPSEAALWDTFVKMYPSRAVWNAADENPPHSLGRGLPCRPRGPQGR